MYDRDHEQDDTPCLDTSFHRHEMGIETASDLAWDRWCVLAQKRLGVTSLDGDEAEDGFSIDSAYEAFAAGRSPADYTDGR